MHRVPRLARTKQLLLLEDRTLVLQADSPQRGYSVIRSPGPDDLAQIMAAVDGVRSLQQVCDELAAVFEADTVVQAIEALRGIVFELPSGAARVGERHRVAVVGGGRLALDLATALAPAVDVTVLWVGEGSPSSVGVGVERVEAAALAGRLAGFPVVVAAHSGRLDRALAINAAALAAGVLCIHVATDRDTIVVGPSTVPYRTACFECSQINWYFENHAADHAAIAIARLPAPEVEDDQLRDALIAEVARVLVPELTGLVAGKPHPTLLSAFVRLSLTRGTQVHELIPSANCTSCHGCNRAGIQLGLGSIPSFAPLVRRPLIADKSGGVRSVELAEARRRAEAAMARLGMEPLARGYSKKVRRRYPELASLPFYSVDPELTFLPDAPIVVGRPPGSCYGKGASPEQAMCSGMFELVERTFQMYRGGVSIVRAPYSAVRDHAIDMPAFTRTAIEIADAGSRVRFDPELEIDWLWTSSLTRDRSVLVPAHSIYAGIFTENGRHPSFTFRGAHIEMPRRGSSGLSAGATREDSILQGLYEVIEHDARLLHHRSGIPAPAIPLDSITEPITKRLVEQIHAAGFELVLRYLSRDIAVPVVEAYLTSRRDLTFYRVPGWGAHHDPAIAIRRAITETVQCIGAAESIASQTFQYGIYSLTNSFHEDRYCIDRIEGEVRFESLPRPDPSWSSSVDYLVAAVRSIVTALPDAELCYFEYPTHGLDGVHVTTVFATHVICNLVQGTIIQDRILNARRISGASDRRVEVNELYLGELKI